MSNPQHELKTFAQNLGADIVGFCKLPTPVEGFSFAVSVGVKLADAVLKTIESAPSFVYFQHYRTANSLLDTIAFRLAREIEKLGFSALPIAASQSLGKNNPYRGVIAHKTVATLSGLGFVGKSGLFLSTEFGSKLRLSTVLTNMPLQNELPVIENTGFALHVSQRNNRLNYEVLKPKTTEWPEKMFLLGGKSIRLFLKCILLKKREDVLFS